MKIYRGSESEPRTRRPLDQTESNNSRWDYNSKRRKTDRFDAGEIVPEKKSLRSISSFQNALLYIVYNIFSPVYYIFSLRLKCFYFFFTSLMLYSSFFKSRDKFKRLNNKLLFGIVASKRMAENYLPEYAIIWFSAFPRFLISFLLEIFGLQPSEGSAIKFKVEIFNFLNCKFF